MSEDMTTSKPVWKRWWFIAGALVLVLAALSGGVEDLDDGEAGGTAGEVEADEGEVDSGREMSLAEAACSDLEGGMSLFQLYRSVMTSRHGDDPGAWSQTDRDAGTVFVTDAIDDECPQFREDWEATIPYQDLYGDG